MANLRSRKLDKMFLQSQARWSCFCRRAAALQELCYQWGGVISAAVYVPLLDGVLVPEEGAPKDWTVPGVIRHLSTFHRQMETEGERLSNGAFCCTLINSVLPGRTRLSTLIRNIKSSLSLASSTAPKTLLNITSSACRPLQAGHDTVQRGGGQRHHGSLLPRQRAA